MIQMFVLSSFLLAFIVLGIYNFDKRLKKRQKQKEAFLEIKRAMQKDSLWHMRTNKRLAKKGRLGPMTTLEKEIMLRVYDSNMTIYEDEMPKV